MCCSFSPYALPINFGLKELFLLRESCQRAQLLFQKSAKGGTYFSNSSHEFSIIFGHKMQKERRVTNLEKNVTSTLQKRVFVHVEF